MTEQELADKRHDNDKYQALLVRWSRLHDDVLAMRRLIAQVEWEAGWQPAQWEDMSAGACPWCGGVRERGGHESTCPAFPQA